MCVIHRKWNGERRNSFKTISTGLPAYMDVIEHCFFHTVVITMVYDLWRIVHIGSDNSSYSADRTLLSRDVCPRKIRIAGVHLFRSHLLYSQIEWNKREPYSAIWANKNNIHVHIWGSNPPVVNIIIIYIECSTEVPMKKITKYYSKGSFPFFSSKTNCNTVVAFLFELYSEIKCYD